MPPEFTRRTESVRAERRKPPVVEMLRNLRCKPRLFRRLAPLGSEMLLMKKQA